MSRLEIILSAMLILSMTFNVVVFIYARGAVTRLLSVSEELGDLQVMIDAFAKHAKSVYELEMFYGDATLEHLMNHAVSFNEQLETFEYIYSLTDQPQLTTEDEEEIDDEENEA
jgi:N-methylhydantoinase B/oxoprolinase/acetone carboxylase alpha subunit